MKPGSIELDENGWPVLLADVAPSGVSRRDPDAKSGNPRHDTRSGKFAPGGGAKKRTPAPANVDPKEFARMRDAVREAARTFAGDLSEEKLTGFISKRAANPAAVNIQQFMQLVQQQHMDDLVDVIYSESRRPRGLKIAAPRGYAKKVLAGMADDDVAEIVERLQARGIKDAHIVIAKRLPKERRETVQPVEAADQFEWIADEEIDLTEYVDGGPPVAAHDPDEMKAIFASMAEHMPSPQIEVKPEIVVHVPPPQRMKVTPVRDANGIITHTIQEPVEDGG